MGKHEFLYELGQAVKLRGSGEHGEVIGRAEYTNSTDNYLVRYTAGDGRLVEGWWPQDALDLDQYRETDGSAYQQVHDEVAIRTAIEQVEAQRIRPGDVVRLKTGGAAMTVLHDVDPWNSGRVTVGFFDDVGEDGYLEISMDPRSLVRLPADTLGGEHGEGI